MNSPLFPTSVRSLIMIVFGIFLIFNLPVVEMAEHSFAPGMDIGGHAHAPIE